MAHFLMTTILLLAFWSTGISASSDITAVPHVDYTQDPPVHRSCVKIECHCEEPRLCEVDGGPATCNPCQTGEFQPDTISSVEIIDARQCRGHQNCTQGWYFVSLFRCFVVIHHYYLSIAILPRCVNFYILLITMHFLIITNFSRACTRIGLQYERKDEYAFCYIFVYLILCICHEETVCAHKISRALAMVQVETVL